MSAYIKRIKLAPKTSRAYEIALEDDLLDLLKFHPNPSALTDCGGELRVSVEREKALFSSWYEMFPRSAGAGKRHGTFRDAAEILEDIAGLGFDTVYLPPIHPIGVTKRKGKNNSAISETNDPGSPWAIGSGDGGHMDIHPRLGSLEDFRFFLDQAARHGLEVAIDLALQCSPDHPYVKKHPDWFIRRPDGSIQFAENPPKKYEDIYPIHFQNKNPQELWEEIRKIALYWVKQGVKIFRVDNPHTKPFRMWEWLIAEIKKNHPDVLFLAEAFTRPKVMQRLAKIGFSQSYTYFTWRVNKWDLETYIRELTQSDMRDYFRPNFWPNTPDILPYHLQHAPRQAFIARFVLAATLSASYGMYGPAFELCVNTPVEGKEEYLNSEKYEIKNWDRHRKGNIRDLIAAVNAIRKRHPALQTTWNTQLLETHNDQIIAYAKIDRAKKDRIVVVVNLDFFNTQSGWVRLPLANLGLERADQYFVRDIIRDEVYTWRGEWNFVELNPFILPFHIFSVTERDSL